jgi:cell volume regulation protein A
MFVARPAAVFLCLAGSDYSLREKLLVSWVGIRGAAPIVLATFPLAAGVEDAALMFRLIFFMVILSVILQGWLLMPVAKFLKVAKNAKAVHAPAPLELEITHASANQEMREYHIAEDHPFAGKTLAEIALPSGALVTMIRRGKSFIPPRGNTKIAAGDGMLIIAEISQLEEIEKNHFRQ